MANRGIVGSLALLMAAGSAEAASRPAVEEIGRAHV